MQLLLLLISAFGAQAARYSMTPLLNDSIIIIDTDKPLPRTLPYYQPIQSQPSYRILSNKPLSTAVSTAASLPDTADIFTQEEFPRDLLEIAQKKLGLKSLDEIPSITELAELLGTNNASETISYIRQLTATDDGIALMKAYMESSDYTDRASGMKNHTTPKTASSKTTTTFTIHNAQPRHKQVTEQQLKKITATPAPVKPNVLKNMRPLYVQNPLPYYYPIPIRPLNVNNKQYNNIPHHLNTSKKLSPSLIHQLARIANVSPKKLESFLKQKPKLAELAIKIIRFPQGQERNPQADSQLLIAVRKVMEQDEDLKKLLTVNTLL